MTDNQREIKQLYEELEFYNPKLYIVLKEYLDLSASDYIANCDNELDKINIERLQIKLLVAAIDMSK